ncbi:unnamed protein product, partial [Meganyctiphanes norvegica]
ISDKSKMGSKLWRDAASLMIIGRAASNTCLKNGKAENRIRNIDYNILFLKRSQKSQFMPNAYVFPGGVVESSDFSMAWMDIFEKCGYTVDYLKNNFRFNVPLPELYINNNKSILPEIGFRIGALRETFEESGILLDNTRSINAMNSSTIEKWRQAVRDDPSQFLSLFQMLGSCPAIWNLHEWSGWLTPTVFKGKKRRFDTAFFITFMDSIPKVIHDNSEMEDLQIVSPDSIIDQWRKEKLWLAPPQVYEVSRLLNFNCFEKLKLFAESRARKGMWWWMPVMYPAKDGIIAVYPGDDLYPNDPDYLGENDVTRIDTTMYESRMDAVHLHRMEQQGLFYNRCIMNIKPSCGHLNPIDPIEYKSSKL